MMIFLMMILKNRAKRWFFLMMIPFGAEAPPHCRCHKKPSKTAVVLIAGVTISGTRAGPTHRTIWCRSTFGPRGPGLSNPTSFLRPALPWHRQQTTTPETNGASPARTQRHFLRDFTLYMTSNDAILWKRCRMFIITPMNKFECYNHLTNRYRLFITMAITKIDCL